MTQNERDEILSCLANTPVEVRRLTEGLSEIETRWKPSSGEFSVVENACHLRDIELDGYTVRINRILNEDQPFLADLNGAQLAEERRYNDQDFEGALDAFTQAREENVRLIQSLTPEQLKRTGTLEGTGNISLDNLLGMIREHDSVHIVELKELREERAQGNARNTM